MNMTRVFFSRFQRRIIRANTLRISSRIWGGSRCWSPWCNWRHWFECFSCLYFASRQFKELLICHCQIVWSVLGIARCFTFGGSRNRVLHDPEIKPRTELTKEQYMKKEEQTTINHFHEKLLKLKKLMKTEVRLTGKQFYTTFKFCFALRFECGAVKKYQAGKRRAEKRHEFMEEFLKEFYVEWDGRAW